MAQARWKLAMMQRFGYTLRELGEEDAELLLLLELEELGGER